MAGQEVKIQHTSMQFSDNKDQHEHDARVLFTRAENKGVWACTGTEAGNTSGNHDLRTALAREALQHSFYIFNSGYGEWVALNRRLMDGFTHGYAGPYIPGSMGTGPSHSARGVAWASATSKVKDRLTHPGTLTFGAAHFLTTRVLDHKSNLPLVKGIAEWGTKHGDAHNVVFLGADVNINDRGADVFMGRPFKTIGDELGKWPPTHGRRAIDVIASYDFDRRVKALRYTVLDDNEMYLASDHYALEGTYELRTA